MTVPAQSTIKSYTANGVTTVFASGFKAYFSNQVQVMLNGVVQATGYTLSTLGLDAGFSVTFTVAPAAATVVIIRRLTPVLRASDFQAAPYFTQEDLLNLDQDLQTMILQERADATALALTVPDIGFTTELPAAALRASKYLAFDELGNAIVTAGSGNATDSQLVTFLQAGFGAVSRSSQSKLRDQLSVRDFGAIGDGTTDDTAAINLALGATPVGGTLVLDAGYTFKVSDGLTLDKRMRLTGTGTLLMEGAAASGFLINVTAPGCVLAGVRASHSTSGSQNNRFVAAYTSDFVADGCMADNFAAGISVRFESGEHFRSTIVNNQILNVRGFGGGPNDTGNGGEADGDGITTWGAMATIANNIVSCKSGSDARIGIHCEGLAANSPTQPFHSQSLFSVTGNIVYGQFRRGIAFEDIDCGVMSGNAVADSTWWLYSLNSSRNSVCSGNTGSYTRQSGQNQGSFYSPVRAAIMGYGKNEGCTFSGNVVRVENNASCIAPFYLQGVTGGRTPYRCSFYNNSYTVVSGTVARMFQLELAGAECEFVGNQGGPFADVGILFQNCEKPRIENNRLVAVAGTATAGIRTESGTYCKISGNHIENITAGNGRAIECFFSQGHQIIQNTIMNALVGVDLFGSVSNLVVNNVFKTVTTQIANPGAGSTTTPNIVIA